VRSKAPLVVGKSSEPVSPISVIRPAGIHGDVAAALVAGSSGPPSRVGRLGAERAPEDGRVEHRARVGREPRHEDVPVAARGWDRRGEGEVRRVRVAGEDRAAAGIHHCGDDLVLAGAAEERGPGELGVDPAGLVARAPLELEAETLGVDAPEAAGDLEPTAFATHLHARRGLSQTADGGLGHERSILLDESLRAVESQHDVLDRGAGMQHEVVLEAPSRIEYASRSTPDRTSR
jgi:hypothetical protein